jgi:hypothetical protein
MKLTTALKTTAAAVVILASASSANAQSLPTFDSICAQPPNPTAQVACASPRLRANAQRNMAAMYELLTKLGPDDRTLLVARLRARSAEHALYCHVGDHPQLPPSPALQACLAYWQDRTFSQTQEALQRVAQIRTQQAITGFLRGAVQGWIDAHPPSPMPQYVPVPDTAPSMQYCNLSPGGNHRSVLMNCQ